MFLGRYIVGFITQHVSIKDTRPKNNGLFLKNISVSLRRTDEKYSLFEIFHIVYKTRFRRRISKVWQLWLYSSNLFFMLNVCILYLFYYLFCLSFLSGFCNFYFWHLSRSFAFLFYSVVFFFFRHRVVFLHLPTMQRCCGILTNTRLEFPLTLPQAKRYIK